MHDYSDKAYRVVAVEDRFDIEAVVVGDNIEAVGGRAADNFEVGNVVAFGEDDLCAGNYSDYLDNNSVVVHFDESSGLNWNKSAHYFGYCCKWYRCLFLRQNYGWVQGQ